MGVAEADSRTNLDYLRKGSLVSRMGSFSVNEAEFRKLNKDIFHRLDNKIPSMKMMTCLSTASLASSLYEVLLSMTELYKLQLFYRHYLQLDELEVFGFPPALVRTHIFIIILIILRLHV